MGQLSASESKLLTPFKEGLKLDEAAGRLDEAAGHNAAFGNAAMIFSPDLELPDKAARNASSAVPPQPHGDALKLVVIKRQGLRVRFNKTR